MFCAYAFIRFQHFAIDNLSNHKCVANEFNYNYTMVTCLSLFLCYNNQESINSGQKQLLHLHNIFVLSQFSTSLPRLIDSTSTSSYSFLFSIYPYHPLTDLSSSNK